jgi:hypothetical protein
MLREGTRSDCGERNFQQRHGLTWWKHGSGRLGWFRSSREPIAVMTVTALHKGDEGHIKQGVSRKKRSPQSHSEDSVINLDRGLHGHGLALKFRRLKAILLHGLDCLFIQALGYGS